MPYLERIIALHFPAEAVFRRLDYWDVKKLLLIVVICKVSNSKVEDELLHAIDIAN